MLNQLMHPNATSHTHKHPPTDGAVRRGAPTAQPASSATASASSCMIITIMLIISISIITSIITTITINTHTNFQTPTSSLPSHQHYPSLTNQPTNKQTNKPVR
ncbi:hypothetical protein PLESTB_001129500 [Pleodorina starrii]|uniref:Uncharacterized protein n=1 Tax=Pleodorina starrii TaxID=330485 RepID=A0A9W6F4W7_9CHLO|nr:hypothetical protein PLESTM_001366900 [Pleodorina starrii]GLC56638.1 hypothetical protein PLESTB_001129500 [Pleodorina starrii]